VTIALTAAAGLIPSLPLAPAIAVKGAYCLLFPVALFALRAFDQRERRALAVVVGAARRKTVGL